MLTDHFLYCHNPDFAIRRIWKGSNLVSSFSSGSIFFKNIAVKLSKQESEKLLTNVSDGYILSASNDSGEFFSAVFVDDPAFIKISMMSRDEGFVICKISIPSGIVRIIMSRLKERMCNEDPITYDELFSLLFYAALANYGSIIGPRGFSSSDHILSSILADHCVVAAKYFSVAEMSDFRHLPTNEINFLRNQARDDGTLLNRKRLDKLSTGGYSDEDWTVLSQAGFTEDEFQRPFLPVDLEEIVCRFCEGRDIPNHHYFIAQQFSKSIFVGKSLY